ncbi:MAG: hypothetical protein GXO25_05390 [Euryarchaeota archaeon]|nr:hypothetical protein [Euryarchaeota archaeon]
MVLEALCCLTSLIAIAALLYYFIFIYEEHDEKSRPAKREYLVESEHVKIFSMEKYMVTVADFETMAQLYNIPFSGMLLEKDEFVVFCPGNFLKRDKNALLRIAWECIRNDEYELAITWWANQYEIVCAKKPEYLMGSYKFIFTGLAIVESKHKFAHLFDCKCEQLTKKRMLALLDKLHGEECGYATPHADKFIIVMDREHMYGSYGIPEAGILIMEDGDFYRFYEVPFQLWKREELINYALEKMAQGEESLFMLIYGAKQYILVKKHFTDTWFAGEVPEEMQGKDLMLSTHGEKITVREVKCEIKSKNDMLRCVKSLKPLELGEE